MLPNKKEVLYLDAAASALKPQSVIDAQLDFLQNHYANSGRGVCERADYADRMVATARLAVAKFISAGPEQIIFTSGATDGLNRIANMLPPKSVVAVSDLDHHSARLPMQEKHKTVLCELDKDFDYKSVPECDAAVITAMSNVLGVPQKIIKDKKRITIIDAAQLVAHEKINVAEMAPDALVFSGHKIGADTGLGILYLKEPDRWQTDKFGGGQFKATGPSRFEAGTLPLTQLAGLPAALAESIEHRAQSIDKINYLRGELEKIDRIKFISPAGAALLTFIVDGMHAYDFGAMMGAHGVCLRVGNMCASWLHQRLGLDSTIRISAGPWNTVEEMDQVAQIIKKVIK
ncbi:MAG: aminotransferase class V-fold PLP-dependent enzyme [Alphaproteobacteria bacterium]|nr:aminotransferase class V-fold PLP-dependent enzyme [Alphaproteobacteria bacterium]